MEDPYHEAVGHPRYCDERVREREESPRAESGREGGPAALRRRETETAAQ